MSEGPVIDDLIRWKTKRFRDIEIPLSRAVDSLSTDEPMLQLRQGRVKTRWLFYDKETDLPAVLVHAGVWNWGSNMDTGNYVPSDQKTKETDDNRLQREPSYKCELSYVFDTTEDPSMYELGHKLEEFVLKDPEFVTAKQDLPRRNWQNGPTPPDNQRFRMTYPLFATRTPYNHTAGEPFRVPYEVHSWITTALSKSENSKWIPDPDKPKLMSYDDDKLVDIKDSDPPYFAKGDIVWYSFSATFAVGKTAWAPNYRLMELVRVGHVAVPVASADDPSMFPPKLPSLELGATVIISDDELSDYSIRESKKRKYEPVSESETLASDTEPENLISDKNNDDAHKAKKHASVESVQPSTQAKKRVGKTKPRI